MSRDVETLRVDLGARGYDVVVGAGLYEALDNVLAPRLGRKRALVVSDTNVMRAQGARFEAGLEAAGLDARFIVVEPGEETKCFASLARVVESMLDHRPERRTPVIAFGGGVVGDLAGLAASLLLRGVPYVQVPTTLLAQIDSSVGGKTAVNTPHGKNLVGAFHQPILVLCDLGALASLPRRELLAGYAEIVKYALIDDTRFFAWLEANGAALLAGDEAARRQAVVTSCRSKARVVALDEREDGPRALLNLGHTFGHAIEAAAGYGAILHGEAVAIGMVLAFKLSARLGLCPPADVSRVQRHLAACGLPTTLPAGERFAADRLVALMAQDKKVREGAITFILARGIGLSFIARDVPIEAVAATLGEALAA
jgi:3-dehydroquinate synthase